MTTRLAHLADLHFGTVPAGLGDALASELKGDALDGVVIAGDLTMRARTEEFLAARDWIAGLDLPAMIIPGNHDLPAYNLWARLYRPIGAFQRAVSEFKRDALVLPDCSVFGLNTTASWQPHLRWQDGRVGRNRARELAREIEAAPPRPLRFVAAHHPFAKIPELPGIRRMRNSSSVLELFASCAVDVVLTGHTHRSFIIPVWQGRRAVLLVGAPTALSSRVRGESNGYWLIEISDHSVSFTLKRFEGCSFTAEPPQTFAILDGGLQLPQP